MPLGKLLVIAGAGLTLIGLWLWFGPKLPWFGKLPGDLHFERGNVHLYLPFGTSLLISLVLSFLIWLLRR